MIEVPVQVKDALREGNLKKNYRMVVLNDDGTEDFTIDNDTLVSESVSIDERMCSGDTIKFGLCEGSSLEFQYFNHPNITDRQVKVFCDVEYGANTPYTIPMGFFTVKKCSRQASTGIIKVSAYNKLQSDYLDQKANEQIVETFTHQQVVYVNDVLDALLGDYSINKEETIIISPHDIDFYGTSVYNSLFNYKYTTLIGDQGILGAGNFVSRGITTSTSVQATMYSNIWKYLPSTNYPLKIRFSQDFDIIDDNYYNAIQDALEKTKTNLTKANMWNAILNVGEWTYNQGGYTPTPTPCTKWGFQVYVEFNDGTSARYGKTLYNAGLAGGTFTDLNNSTLENVKAVYLIQPANINMLAGQFAATMEFNGNNRTYDYYTNTSLPPLEGTYITPKMPDGSTIAVNEFWKYISVFNVTNIETASLIKVDVENLPDVTLRELQTAVFETEAQFGQLDRVTDLFSGVELNHSRLLPQDTLYPSNSLYPYGSGESAFRSQYSKLWADEGNIHKWRYLIITYKGLDGEGNEADFTLQRTINNDGTDDYNCSDNWLFRNLVWTSQQIGEYADAMVAKMRDITWFPFEMWCAGLPYLETGDEIEIPLGNQTYTSYILQRQLKGIQNLQDTYINGTLDIF